MPERVAIVGSKRSVAPERMLRVREILYALPSDTIVVTGCDREGVAQWVRFMCRDRGLVVIVVNAPWRIRGTQAGHLRNEGIVQISDRVIAFPSQPTEPPASVGTWDVVQRARLRKLPHEVVHV